MKRAGKPRMSEAIEIKWDAAQWAGTQGLFVASVNVRWRITETAESIVL
jgi:hypothetical protein